MFVSRIESENLPNFSAKGWELFGKIKGSAERMQQLLIDLVNYSRTMQNDRSLVRADVGKIVQEVLQRYQPQLDEKKAVVHLGILPEATIIPFQLDQLFDHLISNAIKFARKDIPLELTIRELPIEGTEEHGDFMADEKTYVKIEVSDNGIGFQQEFAERIFHLFRRLERAQDYRGTGIGLAICRKIIENHQGYMYAEGKYLGGANFVFYLKK